MSKKQIMEWFYSNSINLTALNIVFIMICALCIALVIFGVYWLTFRGIAYNVKFNISNIIIMLVSTVIMLMISSNIVISLGMVGALSIVRFRTAIKDPKDTIYLFWSIVEGLCIGSQNFKLAIITTLFIAIVLVMCHFIFKQNGKYLIILQGQEQKIDISNIYKLMEKYNLKNKIRNCRITDNYQEYIFEIRAKQFDDGFINDVLAVKGVTSFNWLLEAGDTSE